MILKLKNSVHKLNIRISSMKDKVEENLKAQNKNTDGWNVLKK